MVGVSVAQWFAQKNKIIMEGYATRNVANIIMGMDRFAIKSKNY